MSITLTNNSICDLDKLTHTTHQFCNGVYIRTMNIPKGVLVVGHKHTEDCFNILLKGKIEVSINDDKRVLESPDIFISKAGSAKIALALEDTIFCNILSSTSEDIDEIEDRLIDKEYYNEVVNLLNTGGLICHSV